MNLCLQLLEDFDGVSRMKSRMQPVPVLPDAPPTSSTQIEGNVQSKPRSWELPPRLLTAHLEQGYDRCGTVIAGMIWVASLQAFF